ncbi:transcriptional regulator GutM [Anaerococcus kampingiae]|uniref:Transcriptional regulator GutM n=1 Tax=Anaerococcus kampingae TaxID=3115614 RepID=A0ABW9MBY1_9FIRM
MNKIIFILIIIFILQVLLRWRQVKYYNDKVREIYHLHKNGYMGIGMDKGRFHGRNIVVIVVGIDSRIKEAEILSGISVFAKFRTMKDLLGADINMIEGKKSYRQYSKSINNAIDQIRREKNK